MKPENGGKEIQVANGIKCIKGWKTTITATILMWKKLMETQNQDFLFTQRLNQDSQEIFLGLIRQQSGNNYNPTCIQFIKLDWKLFYRSYFFQNL